MIWAAMPLSIPCIRRFIFLSLLVFALPVLGDEFDQGSCSNHLVVRHPLLKRFPILQGPVGIGAWNRVVEKSLRQPASLQKNFASNMLSAVGINPRYNLDGLDQLPATGPVVIPANHPIGVPDGLALLSIVLQKRQDVKVVMSSAVELSANRQYFIHVDLGAKATSSQNREAARAMNDHLAQGGVLIIFPAGKVSRIYSRHMIFRDPEWRKGFIKLALDHAASILPVYMGAKSPYPYMALRFPLFEPLVAPLLLREALSMADRDFPVHIGRLIKNEKLELKKAEAIAAGENPLFSLTEYVRNRLYTQGHWLESSSTERRYPTPVADIESAAVLNNVLEALKAEQPDTFLHSANGYEVFAFDRTQMPQLSFHHFLRELGRCREETFRLVGEGTGRSRDLDDFDNSYTHLVVWNAPAREIVGAYRLGLSDKIMSERGIEGFYTRDQFPFEESFLQRYPYAIELGRSFVMPKYQKTRHGLFNLFRGVAGFLRKNPRYRYLFGTVSMSSRYQAVSKYLIIEYLRSRHGPNSSNEQLVRAKIPVEFKLNKIPETRELLRDITTLEELDEVVRSSEPEGAPIPTLFNAYLGFDADFLEFAADPDFGTLDGFIVVDMLNLALTKPKSVKHLFGGEDAVRDYASKVLQ
jgi:putative hemolysin